MLYRIVLSQDKKSGRVYFDTHSVGFYHSEGKVVELIYEIVIELRRDCSDEVTVRIELKDAA